MDYYSTHATLTFYDTLVQLGAVPKKAVRVSALSKLKVPSAQIGGMVATGSGPLSAGVF